MPTLTTETIRENPWSAVTHALPPHCTELLLRLACLAAEYCRNSEYLLMHAAREGLYIPAGWQPLEGPDVHEINEGRAEDADRALRGFRDLYEQEFGEFVD